MMEFLPCFLNKYRCPQCGEKLYIRWDWDRLECEFCDIKIDTLNYKMIMKK